MARLYQPLADVTIESAQATLPAPTGASDGVAVDFGESSPQLYLLGISGSTTISLTDASIWGYRNGAWSQITPLNNGDAIALTSTGGRCFMLYALGVFDRLALVGTVSAGTVTAVVTPLQERE